MIGMLRSGSVLIWMLNGSMVIFPTSKYRYLLNEWQSSFTKINYPPTRKMYRCLTVDERFIFMSNSKVNYY